MSLVFILLWGIASADVLTPQTIAKKALDATVLLIMEDGNGQVLGVGSGFFVRTDQIATNFHVIDGAERGIAKRIGYETEYEITSFNVIDEPHDLAILKVSDAGVQPLPLGNSDAVVIGDTCYVAGNPKGYLEGTFSHGLISAIRELQSGKLLQLTAPISPGSSGGPVLNNKGEVIGVSVITITGGQNLNFAIPSNYLNTIIRYREGNANYENGLYQLAIENYDTAIRLNPDYALAYIWRGFAKFELRQHAAAIQDCYTARALKGRVRAEINMGSRKPIPRQQTNEVAGYDAAILLNPNNALAYFWRGFANNNSAKNDAALADCDTAIRLKPDFALAYSERGWAKAELGHEIAAIHDCDSAVQLRPDYAIFYLNRGVAKMRFEKHNTAIEDFDATIKLRPKFALAFYNRGVAKYNLGQHTLAVSDLDTAIRLQPDGADIYRARGVVKDNLGQHTAAILDFDTAISLQPDEALTYYNRGLSKADLGQFSAAISDFDAAIKLQWDFAAAYMDRGVAKANLGQLTAAISDYDAAIRFQPDYALAYYNRGYVKYNLNRTWSAKEDFKAALKHAENAGDVNLKTTIESTLWELY